MLAGGLAAGGRVTRRLAWEITPLDDRDGLVANLVTAALVALGAVAGLPMSTTHVSAGSLAGVGTARGAVAREPLRDIALAWLATVPAAAGFAALAIGLARAWF
jgi:PiT family inorganic phosphate transporter